MIIDPKIIAFHLPQFHPIPENDSWWEPGFTEWTNVAKAIPLFPGHQQPRLPGELGFYDLRLPQARARQAELAREAGVHGFCFWHYWFGHGRRLLEQPVDAMLAAREPDFPFMLGWANQTWTGIWHGTPGRILITQEYPGYADVEQHCDVLMRHFEDRRYIHIADRPLLLVFDPGSEGFSSDYLEMYRDVLGRRHGVKPWFILRHTPNADPARPAFGDACYLDPAFIMKDAAELTNGLDRTLIARLRRRIANRGFAPAWGPRQIDYVRGAAAVRQPQYTAQDIPCMIPNWDNTPRSGRNGWVFVNSSPEAFQRHATDTLSASRTGPLADIYFLKSWNEWAEGNHLEPDRRYGRGWMEAMREAIGEARTRAQTQAQ